MPACSGPSHQKPLGEAGPRHLAPRSLAQSRHLLMVLNLVSFAPPRPCLQLWTSTESRVLMDQASRLLPTRPRPSAGRRSSSIQVQIDKSRCLPGGHLSDLSLDAA